MMSTRAPVILVSLVLLSCGCPEDAEVESTFEIDTGEWSAHTITSPATGEIHTYNHIPSRTPGAPVMVMLPGLLFDSRIFVHLDGLSQEFELVAWNYPESSDQFTGHQLDLARLLDDFVDTLGLEQFVLLGNSMGGFVAMQYFRVQESSRVTSLVLTSTRMIDATEKDRKKRQKLFKFLHGRSDEFLACQIKSQILETKKKNQQSDPQKNVHNIFSVKDPAFYREATDFMYSYDGDSGKDLIDVPTLVLHGSEDELVDAQETKNTKAFLPHAELVVIEGAAHEGLFTHGEEFTAAILDWWNRI